MLPYVFNMVFPTSLFVLEQIFNESTLFIWPISKSTNYQILILLTAQISHSRLTWKKAGQTNLHLVEIEGILSYLILWDPGFIKFQEEQNFVPRIGEQPYTEMLFWQFSNIIKCVKIVDKYQINMWVYGYLPFFFKHGFLLLFLHNSHGTKEIPDCGNLVRLDWVGNLRRQEVGGRKQEAGLD